MSLPKERDEEEERYQEEEEINEEEVSNNHLLNIRGNSLYDSIYSPIWWTCSHQLPGDTDAVIAQRNSLWKNAKKNFAKSRKPDTGTIDHLIEASGNPLCLICREKPREVAFFECGHIISCRACSVDLTHCPLCRELILGKVGISRSADEVSVRGTANCVHCGKLRNGMHYPCGHVCYCSTCGKFAGSCQICDSRVDNTFSVFWS